MPELADVEGFLRIARNADGQRLRSVRVHDAQVIHNASVAEFGAELANMRLHHPRRHGKWLILPMSSAGKKGGAGKKGDAGRWPSVLMHFGMTGMLLWCSPDDSEHKHDRVTFRFDNGELRFRDMRKLKGITLARGSDEVDELLSDLGPDAADISSGELQQRLTRSSRQLKSVLMDQSVLAGLGNLTVDEVLWQAYMPPRKTTGDLGEPECKRLHSSLRKVVCDSSRAGRVPDQRSWLTGHRDETDGRCPRCASRLRQGKVASRTTVWCPTCQQQ